MLITVKVKACAKKFAIAAKGGILHISLTEPAENNRANAELVKEMSKRFVSCRILRGLKSKTKTLEIPDGSDLESPTGLVR
ncbi:MAG: DUF167 family protein [Candidatus Aenigmatarchaeota archaeon]